MTSSKIKKVVTEVVGSDAHAVKTQKKIESPTAVHIWAQLPRDQAYKDAEDWCNLSYRVPNTKTRFEEWFIPCKNVPKSSTTIQLNDPDAKLPYIKIRGEEQGNREGTPMKTSLTINLPQMNYDLKLPKTTLRNAKKHAECALIAASVFDQTLKNTPPSPPRSVYNTTKTYTPAEFAELKAVRFMGTCMRPANA